MLDPDQLARLCAVLARGAFLPDARELALLLLRIDVRRRRIAGPMTNRPSPVVQFNSPDAEIEHHATMLAKTIAPHTFDARAVLAEMPHHVRLYEGVLLECLSWRRAFASGAIVVQEKIDNTPKSATPNVAAPTASGESTGTVPPAGPGDAPPIAGG